jgi:hypothetical protein
VNNAFDKFTHHFIYSMFPQMQLSGKREKSVRWGDSICPGDGSDVDDLSPDTFITEDGGAKLSPLGRYQVS